MSEALDLDKEINENEAKTVDDFSRPGDLTDELFGKEIPSAYDIPLEDINPIWPRAFQENRLWEFFDRLREEDPVHFNETEQTGRYWSLTRYDDIKAVDIDHKNFSSQHGITLGIPIDAPLPEGALDVDMFIAMDPPKHDVQRKTVSPVVAPSNLANMEPLIRERTIEVLDSLPIGETFDWVDTVSIELTTLMLATLFDFPLEDRRLLTKWSDLVTTVGPNRDVATNRQWFRDQIMECVNYFDRLFQDRRANPGFDMVSMLAHGPSTKDKSPMEHLGNLILLIVGGNDTTRNSMTGSVYALNKWPEQYDKLIADPSLISNLVPEIIRWQTPLAYMRRTATKDVEFRGKQIKKDDQILLWYLSANRDEAVFGDNADVVDLERPNADRHLAFGHGIHYCMGARIAELQLRILWEEILPRFERIEVQAEPERTLSAFVKGYTHLPVVLHPKAN